MIEHRVPSRQDPGYGWRMTSFRVPLAVPVLLGFLVSGFEDLENIESHLNGIDTF